MLNVVNIGFSKLSYQNKYKKTGKTNTHTHRAAYRHYFQLCLQQICSTGVFIDLLQLAIYNNLVSDGKEWTVSPNSL